MNQQNPNKISRLSWMNDTELRNNLRILKIRQSLDPQPTVTDGVMKRFGFKRVINREKSKENKQPFAEESKMKLQKKTNLKRPSFKVGIPHHRYWSPTARDTPISHFHGLNRGCRSRKTFLKKIHEAATTKTKNQVQPVACPNMNDSKQEEITQEVVKEENPIDKSETEDEDTIKSNIPDVPDIPNVDPLKLDDSRRPIGLFDIAIFIILYYWILSFFK